MFEAASHQKEFLTRFQRGLHNQFDGAKAVCPPVCLLLHKLGANNLIGGHKVP